VTDALNDGEPNVDRSVKSRSDQAGDEHFMDQRCEQLLPDILASMPDAFITLDREWRCTFLNDEAVAARGKPRDDLLGRTLWDVFPRLADTGAAGELRHVMDERVSVTFEANALVSDRWNEIHAYPTEEGIALFYTDINERKEAERESLRIFTTTRVLLRTAEALTSHAELDEMLSAFADALLRLVPHKRIAIALYDERATSLTVLYSKGERAFQTGSVFSNEQISVPTREAMDQGRPRVIDYDRLSDEEAGSARSTGARLSLVVPLVLAGRRVGVVFIDSPDERISVTDRDVDVVQGIASQAAAVIDNARLLKAESEARKQAKRELDATQLLLEAAGALAEPVELDQVLDVVARVVVRVVGHARSWVFLWDEPRREAVLRASAGIAGLPIGSVLRFETLNAKSRQVLTEKRTQVIDYDSVPPEERGLAGKLGSRLSLLVPLVSKGHVLGLVAIDDPGERREFAEREIRIAEGIAAQAAVAIENARLYGAELEARQLAKQELETTTSLLDGARALTGWTDLHDVARSLAETLLRTTSHSRALVDTWDEERREIEVVASAGKMPVPVGTVWPIDRLSSAARDVVIRRRTKVWDLDELPAEERGVVLSAYQARHMLYVPLVQHDRVVGVIVLDSPGERVEFSEREIRLVEGIASQAAVAIENARLFASVQETARLNEALNSIDAAIHSTPKLEQVTQRVLDDGVRALGCDAGAIEMLEGDAMVVRYLYGLSARDVGRRLSEEEAPNAMRAARQREPLAIEDLATDERVNVGFVKEYVDEYDLQSVLAVPLLVKESAIGSALFFTKKVVKSFSKAEIDFGRKFGTSVGLALENVRLYETSQRDLARTAVLKETATASSTLNAQELAERALDTVHRLLGAKGGVVYRLKRDYGVLRMLALQGYPDEMKSLFEEVALDERSLTAQAVLRDEVLTSTFDQLPEASRERAEAAGEMGNGWLAAPVRVRGRVIGALTLVFDQRRGLDEDDIALFTSLTDELGVGMENARLYAAERERARLGEALTAVDEHIHSTTASDEILRNVVPEAAAALGCESAAMGVREGDHWILRYEHNLRGGLIGRRFEDSQLGVACLAAETRQVVVVDNALEDARVNDETRRQFEARSFGVVPLIARDAIIGIIYFIYHSRLHTFTNDEVDFLRKLGGSVSLALENARLFETERERTRLGRSVAEIHADLASSLYVDKTLPDVLRRTCVELGSSGTVVTDRVERGWRVRVLSGLPESGLRPGAFFDDEHTPSSMRVLQSREHEPYVVEDIRTGPEANRAFGKAAGFAAWAVYPLIVRGEMTGTLSAFFAESHSFSEAERDYLRRVAFAASLAEENSRLYKAEHRVAETLQTALLSLPVSIPGVEFAPAYRSATEEARVGGDFYDLFELEHQRLGITVGDISGHGIDAAVLTSLVKNAIRVVATEQHKTPAEVVASANSVLFSNSSSEIFATVFFGVLDCSDGGLVYCNAGHTTGACLRSSGGLTKLDANSSLVGAFADGDFADSTERLERGDLLFLYTDGLTEARRGREFFGEEGLFDLLAGQAGSRPNEVVRKMVDGVLSFTGGTLSDDLAILALQRGEAGTEVQRGEKH